MRGLIAFTVVVLLSVTVASAYENDDGEYYGPGVFAKDGSGLRHATPKETHQQEWNELREHRRDTLQALEYLDDDHLKLSVDHAHIEDRLDAIFDTMMYGFAAIGAVIFVLLIPIVALTKRKKQ